MTATASLVSPGCQQLEFKAVNPYAYYRPQQLVLCLLHHYPYIHYSADNHHYWQSNLYIIYRTIN